MIYGAPAHKFKGLPLMSWCQALQDTFRVVLDMKGVMCFAGTISTSSEEMVTSWMYICPFSSAYPVLGCGMG